MKKTAVAAALVATLLTGLPVWNREDRPLVRAPEGDHERTTTSSTARCGCSQSTPGPLGSCSRTGGPWSVAR